MTMPFSTKYLRYVVDSNVTSYVRYLTTRTHDVNLNFIKHKTELKQTDHWTYAH